MSEQVIYEDPKYPLPKWARFMAKDNFGIRCYSYKPEWDGFAWRPGDNCRSSISVGYALQGLNEESLCRIVRLSDPAYYVPDNPHTDDEGFLPNDGGGMPEWALDKPLVCILCNGRISAYRIVSKEPESYDISGERADERDIPPQDIINAAVSKHRYTDEARRAVATELHQITGKEIPGPAEPPLFSPGFSGPAWENARAKYLRDADQVLAALEHVNEIHREATDTWPTGRPSTGDGVRRQENIARTPPDWEAVGGDTSVHYPDGSPVEEPVFEYIGDDEERGVSLPLSEAEIRHRNHLAALLRQPVIGMSEWLHEELREARRYEYRAAALQGLSANPSFEDTSTGIIAGWAREQADEMIQKEDSE